MSDPLLKNPMVASVLSAIQNLEEMGAVADTNEYIEILKIIEADISKRLSVARVSENIAFLSETTRDEIKQHIVEITEQCSFDDESQRDYAWDGVRIQGANEMSDLELIEYYEEYCLAYDPEDDELLMKAKAEKEIHDMLKGSGKV